MSGSRMPLQILQVKFQGVPSSPTRLHLFVYIDWDYHLWTHQSISIIPLSILRSYLRKKNYLLKSLTFSFFSFFPEYLGIHFGYIYFIYFLKKSQNILKLIFRLCERSFDALHEGKKCDEVMDDHDYARIKL